MCILVPVIIKLMGTAPTLIDGAIILLLVLFLYISRCLVYVTRLNNLNNKQILLCFRRDRRDVSGNFSGVIAVHTVYCTIIYIDIACNNDWPARARKNVNCAIRNYCIMIYGRHKYIRTEMSLFAYRYTGNNNKIIIVYMPTTPTPCI